MNQDEIIKEQDKQLEEIEYYVKSIKTKSKLIDDQIIDQKGYIQEMNEGMDQSQQKIGAAMKKIGQFLKTENQSQIKVFLLLLFVAIILFLLLLFF